VEIYGQAIDADSGQPIPSATCQRLYPGGEIYSSPVIADAQGIFNGRVPDRTYKWKITSVGYQDTSVDGFPASVVDSGSAPTVQVTVRMQKAYDALPAVTVTPDTKKKILYVGLFVAAVAYAKYKKMF
jgi:hypothetical protein